MNEEVKKAINECLNCKNPTCILVVCGCSTQNNQEDYSHMDIDILLGNRKKNEIVSLLINFLISTLFILFLILICQRNIGVF